MTQVPVTLAASAAAVFVNIWLGSRIAKFRHQYKVSVGDGGQEPLLRRMRAQANFIENAPFFLILVASLELSGANRAGLGVVAAVFTLARIAHAIGMDGGSLAIWRRVGIIISSIAIVLLSIWAILCVTRSFSGG